MFYRVDYTLGIILAGLAAGLLLSPRTRGIAPSKVAKLYYSSVALLLALGLSANIGILLRGSSQILTLIAGVAGSIGGFILGGIFGLAVRRRNSIDLLSQPHVFEAIRMAVAFTFAFAGLGKAFAMPFMTDFFTQSGYSVTFFKFIMIAEVLGGVGLLVPWAFLPSLAGLTVDMFGAVITHIHNGDPLNDSTGAINMLIRLAVVAILWTLQSKPTESVSSTRKQFIAITVAAVLCVLVAVGGSTAVRHLGHISNTRKAASVNS